MEGGQWRPRDFTAPAAAAARSSPLPALLWRLGAVRRAQGRLPASVLRGRSSLVDFLASAGRLARQDDAHRSAGGGLLPLLLLLLLGRQLSEHRVGRVGLILQNE